MKNALCSLLLVLLLPIVVVHAQDNVFSKTPIQAAMRKAFDWQQAHPQHPLNDWTNGAYYAGVAYAGQATGDKVYLHALVDMGRKIHWQPGERWYHADDIAIGISLLELYRRKKRSVDLAPLKATLDRVILYGDAHSWEHPQVQNMLWWWCDALFMGPPVFAKYAAISGNDLYLKACDKWYQQTYEQLYDPQESLWSRDLDYKLPTDGSGKKEQNGKKIFWSRGNGWVFGGLAMLLEELPKDYPNRPFYEKIYRQMAARLKELQPADGAWRSSLLYPEGHAFGESSGTGFYVFGMAYGVRNGYLPAADYLPVIKKGWMALLHNQQENGMVGFVQPIGAAPSLQVNKDLWEVYGTGAFLLAGSEVIQLHL